MDIVELLPNLLRSSIAGDRKTLEATTLMIIRTIRKKYPQVADELSHTLASTSSLTSGVRSISSEHLPVDKESRYALVHVEEPVDVLDPVLGAFEQQQVTDFIKEREMMAQFLKEGVAPPNSILFWSQEARDVRL